MSPNGFDLLVACWLVLGLIRGYKRGISEELLRVTPWMSIVAVAGTYHEDWGAKLAQKAAVSLTWGMVLAYAGIVVGHLLFFYLLRKLAGEKLVESHSFGRTERVLGMLSGAVRYACMALVCLAFVNAPSYTAAELAAAWRKVPPADRGRIRTPTFAQIQELSMYSSCTGQFARERLATFLITPAAKPPEVVFKKHDTRAKKLEKEIEKTLDNRYSLEQAGQ